MNTLPSRWQWDDVRFFLAVVRARSLSGAAHGLAVGHVTVGRRLAQLEHQLGAKLLTRTPDGLMPTPAGQAIVRQCEAMEAAALNLERAVAGNDTRAAGAVRVTATASLAYRFLVPSLVALLRDRHPELQLDLLPGARVLDISRREADLAVRVLASRPTGSRLVCRRIGAVGYALYASPHYLANHAALQRGGGLGGHDLIGWLDAHAPFDPAFMGESMEGAQTIIRTNDPFLQLRATAEGLGISELACFFADECAEVTRVWPHEAPMVWPVWLIVHEDLVRATRIRVVSAAIAETFQHEARVLRHGKWRPGRH